MVLKITQTDQKLLMELHLSLTLNVTAVTFLRHSFYIFMNRMSTRISP